MHRSRTAQSLSNAQFNLHAAREGLPVWMLRMPAEAGGQTQRNAKPREVTRIHVRGIATPKQEIHIIQPDQTRHQFLRQSAKAHGEKIW